MSRPILRIPTAATPAYISGLSPFSVATLSSVSNGKPHFRDAAGSAWQADPSIQIPPAGVNETQHLQAVTNFSGGAYARTQRKLFAHGGGHSDGAYNGLLAFDFSGSSQATGWSLVAGSETVTPSDANSSSLYADGKPPAIHSYQQMWYDESTNTFYRHGGSPWSQSGGDTQNGFKFSGGAWSSITAQPSEFDLGCCGLWDPITRRFYVTRTNNVSHFYDCAGDTWTNSGTNFTAGGGSYTACHDTLRGRFIVFGRDHPVSVDIDRLDMADINFSAKTISNVTTFTPTGDSCPLFTDHGSGAIYDALLDCYWLLGGNAATFDTIYRMNASTFAVTAHALSQTITTTVEFDGLWDRHCFMSDWRAIGVAIAHDQPCYVIRLPSS